VTGDEIGPVCGRYHAAADLLCKRWSVSVVAVLISFEPVRFNQLREAVPGISPKLLVERLRELEVAGIVERRVTASSPVLVEYRLTEKGHALRAIVQALQSWADAWGPWNTADGGARRSG
jgi:DNA-binding HxlR family transcriptional regulator